MEIKTNGSRVGELYRKVNLPNFFEKSTVKQFAEELRAQLGLRTAEASPVVPEQLKTSPVKTESLRSDAAPIRPPAAETRPSGAVAEAGESGSAGTDPVHAEPIRDGAAEGTPAKRGPSKGEPVQPAPYRKVTQPILLVKNEPVAIDPPGTESPKIEPMKIKPMDVGLLKTELMKGSPALTDSSQGEAGKTAGITEPVEYTVKEGDTLWKIGRQLFKADPYQIARDNGITNPNLIRPGQKLIINPPPSKSTPPGLSGEVTASWYGADHQNRLTASGQRFDMNQNTLAHKTLPLGTKVRLVNPENGRFTEGIVNDRGPYIKGRDVDLSYAMAKKLGFVNKGVTKLDIETI